MNIVELNEKNLNDALNVYKKTKARYFEALGKDLPDDKTIEDSLYCDETGAITFLFVEKSVVYGLVTVNKSTAEIENLCIDFAIDRRFGLARILRLRVHGRARLYRQAKGNLPLQVRIQKKEIISKTPQ